ncbi:MAG: FAD-binding oxidoreductase [Pseudomonadota bacterium]
MSQYRASRLPRHRGRAAWSLILGEAPPPRVLEADRTADVVIIGAGFAGLSAARRLKELDPGLRVAVLDAGRIAEGAAGRNSGFMIDLPHDLSSEDYAGQGDDKAVIALNRRAIAFARSAVDAYQIRADYFDPAGKVNAAASEAALAHNRTYAAHLASIGEDSQSLDAAQMRDLTGSRHYLGGLFTAGTVMLQPAGYIRSLAAGLAGDGVDIFEQSAVRAFRRAGGSWQVETDRASVTAARVILTVNGHLESFGIARGRLMHVFLFGAMTPELDADQSAALGGAPRWGVTPSDPMGTSVRRIDRGQGGNRIIVRSAAALRSSMEARPHDLRRAGAVMQRKFDERFPALKGLALAHIWAGHLCLARNGVSVAREVEAGVYSGCVQNGLGTARGTLTGIAAAERALGVASEITAHFDAQADPSRLPPQPFRDLGANVYLRAKEWRARAE